MRKYLTTALTLAVASTLSAQVIFQDSFETVAGANNVSDINLDIGTTRQTSGITSTYTMTGGTAGANLSTNDDNRTNNGNTSGNGMMRIRNNEQNTGGSNGFLYMDTNFGTQLAGNQYTISYDLYYNQRGTSTLDQWVSFVIDETSSAGSPAGLAANFGMLARPSGTGNPNAGRARFYDNGAVAQDFEDSAIPDYTGDYRNFLFSFDETGAGATVSLSVDGNIVLPSINIDFATTDRFFAFGSNLGADINTDGPAEFADSFIDNLTITVIPETSSYSLLGGLLALAWVMVRRR